MDEVEVWIIQAQLYLIFVFHLLANAAPQFISEDTKTCYLKYFTADSNSFDFFALGIRSESSGNFPEIKFCDFFS